MLSKYTGVGDGVRVSDGVRVDDSVRVSDGVRVDDSVRVDDGGRVFVAVRVRLGERVIVVVRVDDVVRGRKYIAVIFKLLPPKLHNELKSQIERIIFALWRINAPPNNQRVA